MSLPGPKTSLAYQTVTETSDTMGGVTQAWSTIATITGVLTASSGTLARFAGNEKLRADRMTVTSTLVFYCDVPTGFTITERGRFVLSTRTFDILFVYSPGNCNHHLEIALFEVK